MAQTMTRFLRARLDGQSWMVVAGRSDCGRQ